MVDIIRLDPDRVGEPETDDALAALHALDVASHPRLDAPTPPLRTFIDRLLIGDSGNPREIWLTRVDDRVVGGYGAVFPSRDNHHLAIIMLLVVDPAYRRRGIGSRLLEHMHARATAAGRNTVFGTAAPDTPGAAFAERMEYTVAAIERQSVLDLSEVDSATFRALGEEAESRAGEYHLERIVGPVPEKLLGDMVLLRMGMNDVPLEDLAFDDEVWDADRCRKVERGFTEGIYRGYLTLARHTASGAIAGWTRIVMDADADGEAAFQEDTGVLAGHRGHRLGLRLKLANFAWLIEFEPGLKRIFTWNNHSNQHMLAINDAMGFLPYQNWAEYQRRLT